MKSGTYPEANAILKALNDKNKIEEFKKLNQENSVTGLYVHKSEIGTNHSVLITRGTNQNEVEIYDLIHEPKSKKKVKLGAGKTGSVREAINIKTGQPVALKIYLFYIKEGRPEPITQDKAKEELAQWIQSMRINLTLPATFVKMHGFCFAGDKSTLKHAENRAMYVIMDKHETTLEKFIADPTNSLANVKNFLIALLTKHVQLMQNGFIYPDSYFCNVLIDKNKNPIFCDPEDIGNAKDQWMRSWLTISLTIELLKWITKNVLKIQQQPPDLLANIVGEFLKNIITMGDNKQLDEKSIFNAISEAMNNMLESSLKLKIDKPNEETKKQEKEITPKERIFPVAIQAVIEEIQKLITEYRQNTRFYTVRYQEKANNLEAALNRAITLAKNKDIGVDSFLKEKIENKNSIEDVLKKARRTTLGQIIFGSTSLFGETSSYLRVINAKEKGQKAEAIEKQSSNKKSIP